jgi:hypothetical protein
MTTDTTGTCYMNFSTMDSDWNRSNPNEKKPMYLSGLQHFSPSEYNSEGFQMTHSHQPFMWERKSRAWISGPALCSLGWDGPGDSCLQRRGSQREFSGQGDDGISTVGSEYWATLYVLNEKGDWVGC